MDYDQCFLKHPESCLIVIDYISDSTTCVFRLAVGSNCDIQRLRHLPMLELKYLSTGRAVCSYPSTGEIPVEVKGNLYMFATY